MAVFCFSGTVYSAGKSPSFGDNEVLACPVCFTSSFRGSLAWNGQLSEGET